MKLVFALFLATFVMGCATSSRSIVRPRSLKSKYVIYFEQSDRVPKDVLMANTIAGTGTPIAGVMSSIPTEIAAEAIKEVLAILPELTETYSQERMFNTLIGRRILFIGYETPEQLEQVKAIMEEMAKAIEPIVPHRTTIVTERSR